MTTHYYVSRTKEEDSTMPSFACHTIEEAEYHLRSLKKLPSFPEDKPYRIFKRTIVDEEYY